MSFLDPQNPGIGGLDELTSAEESFVASLAGLGYQYGDILYYDGSQLQRLPIGSASQVLTVVSSLPSWQDSGGSLTIRNLTVADSPFTETATSGRVVHVCDCSGGNIVINLPASASNQATYSTNKTDSSSNTITVDPDSSEQISGDTTLIIQFENSTASYISTGTEYILI